MKKQNKTLIPALIIIVFLILFGVISFTFRTVTNRLARIQYNEILEQKEVVLQTTVDNLTRDIEYQRQQLREADPTITQEEEKKYITEMVYDRVHNDEYPDGAYIWIEQVVNYEGGDDYAIRLMHPNLTDTEGVYLSTNSTDVKGNHLYREQLEGVLRDGSVVQEYYFPKLHSEKVTRKIAYSRLYKEYDWIIAMGINVDDVEVYADSFKAQIRRYVSKVAMTMGLLLLLLVSSVLLLLSHSDKRMIRKQREYFTKKINTDALTGAYSRTYGEKKMKAAFEKYREYGENMAVMILDVDLFKTYNDTYGHNFGDKVLVEMTRKIMATIRSADIFVRWGGDEFVGLFPGVEPESILEIGDKISGAVHEIGLHDENGDHVPVSVSVGMSYFRNEDHDHRDAFKRADMALYQAKENGRNRGAVL